ncbi:MAG: FAD/NAD(P)-binding oxidoreductase [Candidatus Dormiibacterota bacterium]
MSGARVLILGGGFGGLTVAHTLKQTAPTAELLVVDQSPDFVMGLRKLWTLDGRSSPGDGTRPRSALQRLGIPFRQDTVQAIDLDRRSVRVGSDDLPWDFLVIALGAQGRPDLIPGGLGDNPDMYTFEGAAQGAARLNEIREGRIAIVIAGLPIKCPPAPYEAAMLVDGMLRRMQRRAQVRVEVITPQPMSIPAAGVVACNSVEDQLQGRDIDFRPNAKIVRVEKGRVVLEGETVSADLLLVVPPHRPPNPVQQSGLTGDGAWIQVDPATLATPHEGVFAIGDVVEMKTGAGLPFPKAGVFAERHGQVVGENIAAQINGSQPAATFEGDGYCFLEVGDGEASSVRGNFLANPPSVTIADPSEATLEAKHLFEEERLARWF